MKSDYDSIREALGETERLVLMQLPPNLLAPFNVGEQLLASNPDLLSAVAGFFSSTVNKMPCTGRQAIVRITSFLNDAKTHDGGYCGSKDIVNDFKEKFKMSQTSQSETESKAQPAVETPRPQNPQLAQAAKKILQQMLFRSFFAMLTPKRRERLAGFLEEHKLCDEPLSEELHGRIDDEVERDETKIEALLLQVEKGGLNAFIWLHEILFQFFNGIMEAEERNEELNEKLDKERKLRAEAATGPPKPQEAVAAVQAESSIMPELNIEIERLKVEAAKLKGELAAKDEILALKMEAERAKLTSEYERQLSTLKAERQTLENDAAKLAGEFARKSKLSAHAFETFLNTLPKKYSTPGYTMLRSIVNEWDGDLQSIQAKERKYASNAEERPARKSAWDTIKSFWWIALLLLVLAVGAYGGGMLRKNQENSAVEPRAQRDLRRLEGVKLDTCADISRAIDVLKNPTHDETGFLLERTQELMNVKTEEAPK